MGFIWRRMTQRETRWERGFAIMFLWLPLFCFGLSMVDIYHYTFGEVSLLGLSVGLIVTFFLVSAQMIGFMRGMREVSATYQHCKSSRSLERFSFEELYYYADNASNDRWFWDAVHALLHKDHPHHMHYYLLAGCREIEDFTVLRTLLQEWWSRGYVVLENSSVLDEVTLY